MGEVIIDGTGSGWKAAVTSEGRLKVDSNAGAATVGSESFLYGVSGGTWMPLAVQSGTESILRTTSTVSLTEESVGKIEAPTPGSATYNAMNYNGSLFPLRTDTGSHLMMAGSISSMPSVTATNDSVAPIGSTHTGSGTLIGGDYLGSIQSVRMDLGSYVMVAGSISSMPPVSASNESISEITTPHTGSATFIGGNFNGSLYPILMHGGSQVLITGSVQQGTTPWVTLGSVNVDNASSVGSLATQQVSGTLDVTNFGELGSSRVIPAGSVIITNTPTVTTGSESYNFVDSGGVWIIEPEFRQVVMSGTPPISVTNFGDLGSDRTISNRVAGSIVNMPIVGVSGTALAISGIVNQGTNPWITLGSTRVIPGDDIPIVGSVYQLSTPGSVAIYGNISTSNPSVGEIGSPHTGSATVIAGDWGGSTAVFRMDGGSYALIAGSISSMPSVTATNDSVAPIGSPHTTSGTLIGGDWGGSLLPIRMDIGSYALVAGSISSMPSVNATNESVAEVGTPHLGSATLLGADFNGSIVSLLSTAGSELIITGSVNQNTDPWIVLGSSRMVPGDDVPIIGSVYQVSSPGSHEIFGTLSATNPSVAEDGTAHLGSSTIIAGLSGGITMPLMTTNGSLLITTGSVFQGTPTWSTSGAVSNLGELGSQRTISAGSVIITNSPTVTTGSESFLYGVSGGTWMPLGVRSGTESILLVDVRNTTASPANVDVQNFDTLGSSRVVTNFGALGSDRTISNRVAGSIVNIPGVDINNPQTIGSFTEMVLGSSTITNFGNLGSQRTISAGSVIITNTVGVSGIVNQGTDPWIVLGSQRLTNPFISTGSEVFNHVQSGTAWIAATEFQDVILSGTPPISVDNFGDLGSDVVVTNFGDVGSSRVIEELPPTDVSKNNPRTKIVYSGANFAIGSIFKYIGTGSYVQVLSYDGNDNLSGVSPWTSGTSL